jgi:hypothetical protein
MSTETGAPETDADDEATDRDRRVFRRLGVMTIVWVLLLVAAGLLLLFYGPALSNLVV